MFGMSSGLWGQKDPIPGAGRGISALISKKVGVGVVMGQEMPELQFNFQKRRQARFGECIRILQVQVTKSILTNVNEKGKILARNWVVETRDKSLKKYVLK